MVIINLLLNYFEKKIPFRKTGFKKIVFKYD